MRRLATLILILVFLMSGTHAYADWEGGVVAPKELPGETLNVVALIKGLTQLKKARALIVGSEHLPSYDLWQGIAFKMLKQNTLEFKPPKQPVLLRVQASNFQNISIEEVLPKLREIFSTRLEKKGYTRLFCLEDIHLWDTIARQGLIFILRRKSHRVIATTTTEGMLKLESDLYELLKLYDLMELLGRPKVRSRRRSPSERMRNVMAGIRLGARDAKVERGAGFTSLDALDLDGLAAKFFKGLNKRGMHTRRSLGVMDVQLRWADALNHSDLARRDVENLNNRMKNELAGKIFDVIKEGEGRIPIEKLTPLLRDHIFRFIRRR